MMLLRKIVAPQYICSVHFNSHTLVPHSYAMSLFLYLILTAMNSSTLNLYKNKYQK